MSKIMFWTFSDRDTAIAKSPFWPFKVLPLKMRQNLISCIFRLKIEMSQNDLIMGPRASESAQIGFSANFWPRNTILGKIGKSQFSRIF